MALWKERRESIETVSPRAMSQRLALLVRRLAHAGVVHARRPSGRPSPFARIGDPQAIPAAPHALAAWPQALILVWLQPVGMAWPQEVRVTLMHAAFWVWSHPAFWA